MGGVSSRPLTISYTTQCALVDVQCTVDSAQCTVYSVHSTVYSVQYTLFNVQTTVYREQCVSMVGAQSSAIYLGRRGSQLKDNYLDIIAMHYIALHCTAQ